MSTRQGTHPEHVALTGFVMIGGGGAYPKKSSGAKKLLRLSPPHRVQSPEVPFLLKQGREKAKATPKVNGCVALRYNSGDCID